jgi:hypothetical protein
MAKQFRWKIYVAPAVAKTYNYQAHFTFVVCQATSQSHHKKIMPIGLLVTTSFICYRPEGVSGYLAGFSGTYKCRIKFLLNTVGSTLFTVYPAHSRSPASPTCIMHKIAVVILALVIIASAETAWLYSDLNCPSNGVSATCTNLPVSTCCVDHHTVWFHGYALACICV